MQFIGSSYQGLTTADGKRFDQLGEYTFPNGDRYVGGMLDGVFHGNGIIFFRKHHRTTTSPMSRHGSGGGGDGSADADGKGDLMAFLNGTGSGGGGAADSIPFAAAAAAVEEEEEDVWGGQLRGLWSHGRSVVGTYLFRDGLPYSSESGRFIATSINATTHHNEDDDGGGVVDDALARTTTTVDAVKWPYCECNDRRMWSEHLRNITPVLPYESPLGGIALQEALMWLRHNHINNNLTGTDGKAAVMAPAAARMWSDMPILVPSSPETDLIPAVFAAGQPHCGADAVKWGDALLLQAAAATAGTATNHDDTATTTTATVRTYIESGTGSFGASLDAIAAVIALPTAPLVPEQDPDVEIADDGTVRSRRRVVTDPNYHHRKLLTGATAGVDVGSISAARAVPGDGSKRNLAGHATTASVGVTAAAASRSAASSSSPLAASSPVALLAAARAAAAATAAKEREASGDSSAVAAAAASSDGVGRMGPVVAPAAVASPPGSPTTTSSTSSSSAPAVVAVAAGAVIDQIASPSFAASPVAPLAAAAAAGMAAADGFGARPQTEAVAAATSPSACASSLPAVVAVGTAPEIHQASTGPSLVWSPTAPLVTSASVAMRAEDKETSRDSAAGDGHDDDDDDDVDASRDPSVVDATRLTSAAVPMTVTVNTAAVIDQVASASLAGSPLMPLEAVAVAAITAERTEAEGVEEGEEDEQSSLPTAAATYSSEEAGTMVYDDESENDYDEGQ